MGRQCFQYDAAIIGNGLGFLSCAIPLLRAGKRIILIPTSPAASPGPFVTGLNIAEMMKAASLGRKELACLIPLPHAFQWVEDDQNRRLNFCMDDDEYLEEILRNFPTLNKREVESHIEYSLQHKILASELHADFFSHSFSDGHYYKTFKRTVRRHSQKRIHDLLWQDLASQVSPFFCGMKTFSSTSMESRAIGLLRFGSFSRRLLEKSLLDYIHEKGGEVVGKDRLDSLDFRLGKVSRIFLNEDDLAEIEAKQVIACGSMHRLELFLSKSKARKQWQKIKSSAPFWIWQCEIDILREGIPPGIGPRSFCIPKMEATNLGVTPAAVWIDVDTPPSSLKTSRLIVKFFCETDDDVEKKFDGILKNIKKWVPFFDENVLNDTFKMTRLNPVFFEKSNKEIFKQPVLLHGNLQIVSQDLFPFFGDEGEMFAGILAANHIIPRDDDISLQPVVEKF